jgi:hypothetical protein
VTWASLAFRSAGSRASAAAAAAALAAQAAQDRASRARAELQSCLVSKLLAHALEAPGGAVLLGALAKDSEVQGLSRALSAAVQAAAGDAEAAAPGGAKGVAAVFMEALDSLPGLQRRGQEIRFME